MCAFCYDTRHRRCCVRLARDGHPFWNMGMGGVSTGLLSWAVFRLYGSCYFSPVTKRGGFELLISACTLLSGMVWALVVFTLVARWRRIWRGNCQLRVDGDRSDDIIIRAKHSWYARFCWEHSSTPRHFTGEQGDWRLVLPSLALGLIFWLCENSRALLYDGITPRATSANCGGVQNKKAWGLLHHRSRLRLVLTYGISQNIILPHRALHVPQSRSIP